MGDSGDEDMDDSRSAYLPRVGDCEVVGVEGTEVVMCSMCLCKASC